MATEQVLRTPIGLLKSVVDDAAEVDDVCYVHHACAFFLLPLCTARPFTYFSKLKAYEVYTTQTVQAPRQDGCAAGHCIADVAPQDAVNISVTPQDI